MLVIGIARHLSVAAVILSAFAAPVTYASDDGLTPTGQWSVSGRGASKTPPMGWNSFNAFRIEVSEEKVMGAAHAIVDTGLAKLGYVYINIDDGWWLKRRTTDGRMIIRTSIFPSADVEGAETTFRPFVDNLHKMGLKAGIYSEIGRNACSQAWNLRSPNLPEGSVAEREVGLEGYVDQDIALYFKEWGFDYIKVDACGVADYGEGAGILTTPGYRQREPLIVRRYPALDNAAQLKGMYDEVSDALAKHNPDNDYVFSICSWGRADVRQWGKDVGNLWRTSDDINPTWASMLQNYDTAVGRPLYAGPGQWNDPDMLFVGTGEFDVNNLTKARSHFALWAMLNAPLIIGYDLRNTPQSLLDIWANQDLVAINQDTGGHQAVLAYRSTDVQVLVKTLSNGRKAVAIFNRSGVDQAASLTSADLKYAAESSIVLRDLWTKQTLPAFVSGTEFTLKPYEVLVFEASGTHLLPEGVFLSEIPGRVHVARDGVVVPEMDPDIYMRTSASTRRGSGDIAMYAGWGGAQADATPYGTGLAIGRSDFRNGLGILSNSRMEVQAGGDYRRFAASVGIDNTTRDPNATVQFFVYGDGRLLAKTDVVAFGEAATDLTADITGVKIVELVVRKVSGTDQPAAVTWGDARFEN
ncbi:MAG: NPCBM/NEW2 domain-containing protein [Asticcacaulis sp.]